MNKRECVCCGAPIPLGVRKCEYCGMTYDPGYWDGTIQYVPIRTGRRRLHAAAAVDDIVMDHLDKTDLARYVKHDLAGKLAEGLTEMMAIRMNYDPCRQVTIVEGEVWVEEPDRRTSFDNW